MATEIIRFGLSVREIYKAMQELETYKQDLIRKTELLRGKIAAHIASDAQSRFTGALVEDLLKGGRRLAEVEVSVTDHDNISIVIANGQDAVWVEFGAGVYHNGSAGGSPHPKGPSLGFTIGDYDKGMGKKATWGFYEDGELRLTHGTPAKMPMYNAVKAACSNISALAREVFG